MAALTVSTPVRMRILSSAQHNYKVANSNTIYLGSIVGLAQLGYVPLTADRGFAIPFEDTANVEYLGIAINSPFDLSVTNTVVGDTSASVLPEITVEGGVVVLQQVTVTGVAAAADVGNQVFGATDNPNDLTDSSNSTDGALGEVERFFSGTTSDVLMYGRAVYAAQNA